MRLKVGKTARRYILTESRRNPYLGTRKLTELLKTKYNLEVSKSTINNVVSDKIARSRPGNKNARLLYIGQTQETGALFLLKALDYDIGLFPAVGQACLPYFPEIDFKELVKIIQLISFGAYLGVSIGENHASARLSRLCGLRRFSDKKIKYFFEKISNCKPTAVLTACRDNIQVCSGTRIKFCNDYVSYCDAGMTTLWNKPCATARFFAPLGRVRRLLQEMIFAKLFCLNYFGTDSNISIEALEFIQGISSGVEKIELLNAEGKVIDQLSFSPFTPSFCLGYYPRLLSKSVTALEKVKRAKRFKLQGSEFYYWPQLSRFSQKLAVKGVILNNLLTAKRPQAAPFWGLMTDKRKELNELMVEYTRLWPNMEKNFLLGKESAVFSEQKNIGSFIPEKIILSSQEEIKQLTVILADVFSAWVGEFDFTKNYCGYASRSNKLYAVNLPMISEKTKTEINKAGLMFAGRRVFAV